MRVAWIALAAALAVAAGAQDVPTPPPGGGLFFNVMPVTREGYILVPLRPLVEWARGRVDYDQGRVAIYEEGATNPRLELTEGSTEAKLSGVPQTLPVAPQELGGRLFGPLKSVADALGLWVEVEGRMVRLRLPQLGLEAELAIPPDAESHQGKIWKQLAIYYGLPQPTPVDVQALPHWNLFAAERKRELLAEVGRDAPTIIESHWGDRPVAGMRVMSDAADGTAGAAITRVMVRYDDGAVYEDSLGFVLEPDGWRIRRQSSAQQG